MSQCYHVFLCLLSGGQCGFDISVTVQDLPGLAPSLSLLPAVISTNHFVIQHLTQSATSHHLDQQKEIIQSVFLFNLNYSVCCFHISPFI